MFRKLVIALGATAALGLAALAPTTASAHPGHGWHGHHGHHGHHWRGGFGFGFYPAYVGGSDCYVVRRLVRTPYGPRWRRVTVCD